MPLNLGNLVFKEPFRLRNILVLVADYYTAGDSYCTELTVKDRSCADTYASKYGRGLINIVGSKCREISVSNDLNGSVLLACNGVTCVKYFGSN